MSNVSTVNKVRICFNFNPSQRDFPWSGTVNWGDGTTENITIPNDGCFEHTYIDTREYTIIVDIRNECSSYFVRGTVRNNTVIWGQPIAPGIAGHGPGCTCGNH